MSIRRTSIAALALSAAGLVGIVTHESYTDRAVIPVPGDVPTVGFGSTRRDDGTPVRMGDRTTPPQALERALRDVTKFEGALRDCVHVELAQGEYDAYVSLAYNIGAGAFCGSTLVKKLNARDYAGACAEISKWDRMGGRQVPGLTRRRAEERAKCEAAA